MALPRRLVSSALSLGLAASALSTGAVLATGSPAAADSGFCGVKWHVFTVGWNSVYEVYNKCSSAHNFRVVLDVGTNHRPLDCKTVYASGIEEWVDSLNTNTWHVENC